MVSRSKLIEFQKDLRNGLSIDEACSKHDVGFAEAVLGFHPLQKKKKSKKNNTGKKVKCHTPSKYIFQRDDRFTIRKTIKYKTLIFGTYNSLEDAIRVRDELINIGWKQRSVDSICEQFGINRRKGTGWYVRYS